MKNLIATLLVLICSSQPSIAQASSAYKSAKRFYRANDYAWAASKFYDSMNQSNKKKNYSIRHKSEWSLAQSLEKMDLAYSASMYYSKIVRRGPKNSNPFFRKALEALGRINNNVNLGQSHVVALFKTKINPASIPGPARGFYFYYKGVEAFSSTRYKSAKSFLKRVQSGSRYYIKALFHLGVIANLSGNHQAGIRHFNEVRDLANSERNSDWLQEQANLNIARIYYETRRYRDSIRYYAEIPRSSENWLQALFEAAWAFFLMEKANNTLGNIHTLHSPFFDNRFFPESYILQAITFLRLCRYDRVRESMTLFKKRYAPVLRDIKSLLAKNERNPKNFFKQVYNYRRGSMSSYKNAWAILDALARTDSYKQAGATIKNADRELARLSDSPRAWRKMASSRN